MSLEQLKNYTNEILQKKRAMMNMAIQAEKQLLNLRRDLPAWIGSNRDREHAMHKWDQRVGIPG